MTAKHEMGAVNCGCGWHPYCVGKEPRWTLASSDEEPPVDDEPDFGPDDEHKEPPRPEPDFRIYVTKGPYDIDVTYQVMDAYDLAVGSMDLGSGFMSSEDVASLRYLGNAIGAEHFDYTHDKCLSCGHEWEFHGGRYGSSEQTKCNNSKCKCKLYVTPYPAEETP